MAEILVFKETAVPGSPQPHAWYLLKEGANPYFTLRIADSGGSLVPLNVDVLGTLLAGYSAGANVAIESTDNVLQAFQKTQGQINNLNAAVAGGIKIPFPLDASGNPDYPAATKGDSYIITVAGKIGGASGIEVQAGDVVNALNDNAGGDQATVGDDWYIIETNQSEANDTTMGYVRRGTIAEVNAGTDVNAYVSTGRLRAGVRNTTLSGLSVGVSTPVVAGDDIITAAGKWQAQINNRVVSNSAITAGTHTKITYDAKGLVTGGADLSESDIPSLTIAKITGLQTALDGKVTGTGTAGQVSYWNGTNTQTGSNLLFWDNVTARLGIGTNSMDCALHIKDSLPRITLEDSEGGLARIYGYSGGLLLSADDGNTESIVNSSTIRFRTDGVDKWTILETGIFESTGAQTIRTSTGNLILATNGGNGNILLSPHGTGTVRHTGTIPNATGNFATYSATGVLQQRTAAQVLTDIGAQAAGSYVPTSRTLTAGVGIGTIGDLSANRTIGLTGLAAAFAQLSSNGFAVRTAAGAAAARTITGSDSIEVTNGNGVSGNPTIKMQYAGTPAW